jgi:hypothetical protein
VSAPAKLAAFALIIVATFGLGAALGSVVGPLDVDGTTTDTTSETTVGHDEGGHR